MSTDINAVIKIKPGLCPVDKTTKGWLWEVRIRSSFTKGWSGTKHAAESASRAALNYLAVPVRVTDKAMQLRKQHHHHPHHDILLSGEMPLADEYGSSPMPEYHLAIDNQELA